MTCEIFTIGSLAGLALTAEALAIQFFNNKRKEQQQPAVERKELEKEQISIAPAITM